MVRRINTNAIIYSIFSLCLIISSEVPAKDFDCIEFLRYPLWQQREQLTVARDQFIEYFNRSENHGFSISDLANLLKKKDFDPEIGNGVYLTNLPDFILDTRKHIDDDFLKALTMKINALEEVGKCFHYQVQETSTDPLMALKLYTPDQDSAFDPDTKLYMGYTTVSVLNGIAVKQARFTAPEECDAYQCTFTNVPLAKAKKSLETNSVIRLIHNPKELEKVVHDTPEQPDEKLLPSQTWLTEVTLYKTGEIFTRPEIYVTIAYYSGEELIHKNVKPLPWVLKKGLNTGYSLLLDWPAGSDKAKLAIMESDMDIPYRSVFNIILDIFQNFISDSSVSSGIDSISERLEKRPQLGKSWGDDDFIGKATIYRRAKTTEVITYEETAILKLQHKHN